MRGDYGEVVQLLLEKGGKVMNKEGELVDLAESPLSGNVRIFGGGYPSGKTYYGIKYHSYHTMSIISTFLLDILNPAWACSSTACTHPVTATKHGCSS